jgi:hypothetical protein
LERAELCEACALCSPMQHPRGSPALAPSIYWCAPAAKRIKKALTLKSQIQ